MENTDWLDVVAALRVTKNRSYESVFGAPSTHSEELTMTGASYCV
jgi:hypothetical protein